MIYLYDNAIADDLRKSIDPSGGANSIVKVMDKSGLLGLIAELKEDKIEFPVVCLMRNEDTPVDDSRMNFTRLHRGVQAVFDTDTHNWYLEKVLPIRLGYKLIVLATNTVDRDEIVKEILFKYTSMYFITMQLPYECKRKIRFGVSIDSDVQITNDSGSYEYLSEGKLYETNIPLKCEGAVLVSYTPKHLQRTVATSDIVIENPKN